MVRSCDTPSHPSPIIRILAQPRRASLRFSCRVPFAKIFRFTRRANHLYKFAPSHPTRGAYHDRHERGVGCGGRGSVLRATGLQGGFLGTCERSPARGREMLQRTAKSCGPDAPMLASSLAEFKSAQPGLDKTYPRDDGGKRARSPGRARHKPLKPLRAGMSGDSGVLVVTRVRSTNTKCTRGRGCIRHPAFPTPLFGARDKSTARALRAASAKSYMDFPSLRGATATKQSILSL